MTPEDGPRSRWAAGVGDDEGALYAERFDQLAAAGVDVHGEATLCASLLAPGGRVLDAGCGTGRVAIRLAELGYECTGVDLDASMLAEARLRAPDLTWVEADLATLDLGPRPFDLVVAAGNVIPLVAAGAEPAVVAALARHVRPGGRVVTGFGLDRVHLPRSAALIDLAHFDRWAAEAGLRLGHRFATWQGEPYAGGGYAVSVHVRG